MILLTNLIVNSENEKKKRIFSPILNQILTTGYTSIYTGAILASNSGTDTGICLE